MPIQPIATPNHNNRTSFKGSVDNVIKKELYKDLEYQAKSKADYAAFKNESVDKELIKTLIDNYRDTMDKLEEFMKQCHPKTKLTFEKDKDRNSFSIVNTEIGTRPILFTFKPTQTSPIENNNIKIKEPIVLYGKRSLILSNFEMFVKEFTEKVTPKQIDEELLNTAKNSMLEFMGSNFINKILTQRTEKKLRKFAEEIGVGEEFNKELSKEMASKREELYSNKVKQKLEKSNRKTIDDILKQEKDL